MFNTHFYQQKTGLRVYTLKDGQGLMELYLKKREIFLNTMQKRRLKIQLRNREIVKI